MKLIILLLMLLAQAAWAGPTSNGKGNGQILCKHKGEWVPFEYCLTQSTETFRGIEALPEPADRNYPVQFRRPYKQAFYGWVSHLEKYLPDLAKVYLREASVTSFIFVDGDLSLVPENYQNQPIRPENYLIAAVYFEGTIYVSLKNMEIKGGSDHFTKLQNQGFVFFHEMTNAVFEAEDFLNVKHLSEDKRILFNELVMKSAINQMAPSKFYSEFFIRTQRGLATYVLSDKKISLRDKIKARQVAVKFNSEYAFGKTDLLDKCLISIDQFLTGEYYNLDDVELMDFNSYFCDNDLLEHWWSLENRGYSDENRGVKQFLKDFGISEEALANHKNLGNKLLRRKVLTLNVNELSRVVYSYHPIGVRSMAAAILLEKLDGASEEELQRYSKEVVDISGRIKLLTKAPIDQLFGYCGRAVCSPGTGIQITPDYAHKIGQFEIYNPETSSEWEVIESNSFPKMTVKAFESLVNTKYFGKFFFEYHKRKLQKIHDFSTTDSQLILKLLREKMFFPDLQVEDDVIYMHSTKLNEDQKKELSATMVAIIKKFNLDPIAVMKSLKTDFDSEEFRQLLREELKKKVKSLSSFSGTLDEKFYDSLSVNFEPELSFSVRSGFFTVGQEGFFKITNTGSSRPRDTNRSYKIVKSTEDSYILEIYRGKKLLEKGTYVSTYLESLINKGVWIFTPDRN